MSVLLFCALRISYLFWGGSNHRGSGGNTEPLDHGPRVREVAGGAGDFKSVTVCSRDGNNDTTHKLLTLSRLVFASHSRDVGARLGFREDCCHLIEALVQA